MLESVDQFVPALLAEARPGTEMGAESERYAEIPIADTVLRMNVYAEPEFREGRQTGRCRALKAKDGGQSKIDEVVVSGRAGISVPVSHRRFEMGAEMPITGFQPFHTQVPAQGSAVALHVFVALVRPELQQDGGICRGRGCGECAQAGREPGQPKETEVGSD